MSLVKKVLEKIADYQLVVASNTEPYVHYYEDNKIKARRGTGGVVTALDPLMQESNGVWVAISSGDADKEATKNGEIMVPEENPSYTLKRLFLPKKQAIGYNSAANGAIWPLSHVVYVRPRFVDEDWEEYKKVNKEFAKAILEKTEGKKSLVWIHDYHLMLCPSYLKKADPSLLVGFFWHIPWPSAQVFGICPWRKEIVDAMLSNDFIGFHTKTYVNNFLDSVDTTLEAIVDRTYSKVTYQANTTQVNAFPISIDYNEVQRECKSISEKNLLDIKKKLGLPEIVAVGVDRLDYIKGLHEKFMAVDYFLEKNPEYQKKFSLIQVASPTRLHLPEYKKARDDIEDLSEEINWKYSDANWKPIHLIIDFVSPKDVNSFYKLSDVCMVTSLHDGMNLVSKEFVASKLDGNGVLVLSKFAGSSNELNTALKVNPYSVKETADALKQAIKMPLSERVSRMNVMQAEVKQNDVFNWAANFLVNFTKVGAIV